MKKIKDLDSVMGDINEKDERENAADEKVEHMEVGVNKEDSDEDIGGIMSLGEYSRISYDKFDVIDLRVAEIKEVEVHESARKPMFKLKLNLGELGERTIVAGISAFYGKDELIGKKIVVVANLIPKNIAGIVSDGMLLAAEDELNVSLIVPDKDAEPGSRIR